MTTEPRTVQLPSHEFEPIDAEKFEADFPTEAEPDAIDRAWWQGHTVASEEHEAERRDLEMTIARLEAMIADYRAELTHHYHD